MICAVSNRILNEFGQPFPAAAPAERRQLGEIVPAKPRERRVDGTYDAARDSDDFKNYWANADVFSADFSNSKQVRARLTQRSRYESQNNGFVAGILKTYANDVVGCGPKLRMQTGSSRFNSMVEQEWDRWCKATLLRRKLWCMSHAKCQDGEGIGIVRTNPRVKHNVKLDVVLYETEQCQSFETTFGKGYSAGYIDGIKFDEFGNPEWYDILPYHPGGVLGYEAVLQFGMPEQVPAEYVLHWFAMLRPGQHRGVPEMSSTLNVGASSRRFREATVASAETCADFSVFLKTGFQPQDIDQVAPMTTLDIQKRMMTALPTGWDPMQMKSEHPNATYEAFIRSQLNETGRPLNMPYNKAACDSSSYNYASGRLDHQTYYGGLDVDREDGNDLVLDPLFALWWDEAVRAFGWLGGNPDALSPYASSHAWDWPKHPVADVTSESSANDQKLRNGSLSLSRLYAENGEDFEDELPVLASNYFGEEDPDFSKTRELLRNALFNNQAQQSSLLTAETGAKVAARPQPVPAQSVEKFNAQID